MWSLHAVDAQTFASSLLTLQGAGAYDAAVHCASVSAARRLLQQQHYGVADSSLQPRSPLGFRCGLGTGQPPSLESWIERCVMMATQLLHALVYLRL